MPYEITIHDHFAAAHAIRLPDDTLEPLHGHDWHVAMTVGSNELDSIETVMDFHDLQAMLDKVISPFRNGHLNNLPPFAGEGGKLAINPTAERVARWIGEVISRDLPAHVALLSVRVEEATGCFAVWRP